MEVADEAAPWRGGDLGRAVGEQTPIRRSAMRSRAAMSGGGYAEAPARPGCNVAGAAGDLVEAAAIPETFFTV
jgi:hypothetical protein